MAKTFDELAELVYPNPNPQLATAGKKRKAMPAEPRGGLSKQTGKTRTMSTSLSADLYHQMMKEATVIGITASAFIRMAVEDYLRGSL